MTVHLRDVRYFVAVADELSFTLAAQRLYVSQPGLSKQIRALELQLGAALFERGSRSVTLTETGAALLPHARRALSVWDDAELALREAAAVQARTLRVGFTLSVGRGLLASAMSDFGGSRPGWRLDLRQSTFDDPTAGLPAGRVDLALVALPLEEPWLRHRVLFTEERLVAVPIGHPLDALDEIPFALLVDEPFLALPARTPARRAFWLADDLRGGRPARIGAVVNGPEEAIEALARGVGVALMSAGSARMYQRAEFTTHRVPELSDCQLAIAWRIDDDREMVRDFVSACVRAAERAGPPASV